MRSHSAAAILGLLAVSADGGLAVGDPEGAPRRSTFELLGLLPSMKATCNGLPAALPDASGLGGSDSSIECWGKYEVEGPFQEVDGDTGVLYGNTVRASFSCDGLFQASTAPVAAAHKPARRGESRITADISAAIRAAVSEEDAEAAAPKLQCKGDFRQWTVAVDASAAAAQDGSAQERLAVVETIECSAELTEHAGGPSDCWATDEDQPWSAGASESLTFRVFPPSTSLEDMDAAISEHLHWLATHDVEPSGAADGAGAAAADVHCEYACDGEPMQGDAACQEGFKSTCSVALSSERYAVGLVVDTECVGDAKLKPESKEHTCWGALGFRGKETVDDKAASHKAVAAIGDGGYIGLETATPIVSHDWAGMRIKSAVPHDGTGVNYMSA